jgi:dolichol kinase
MEARYACRIFAGRQREENITDGSVGGSLTLFVFKLIALLRLYCFYGMEICIIAEVIVAYVRLLMNVMTTK